MTPLPDDGEPWSPTLMQLSAAERMNRPRPPTPAREPVGLSD